MVEIFDKYKRPAFHPEKGGGKRLVERGSHVPVMKQVREMILAGERLGEFRQEAYDFPNGVDVPSDVVPDPTRSSNFDLADATQLGEAAGGRLAVQAKEASIAGSKPAGKVEGGPPVAEPPAAG